MRKRQRHGKSSRNQRICRPSIARVMPERRFPSPWIIEEQPACFIVKDANGQEPAFV
jgi:hypothetical protein